MRECFKATIIGFLSLSVRNQQQRQFMLQVTLLHSFKINCVAFYLSFYSNFPCCRQFFSNSRISYQLSHSTTFLLFFGVSFCPPGLVWMFHLIIPEFRELESIIHTHSIFLSSSFSIVYARRGCMENEKNMMYGTLPNLRTLK